MLNVHPKVHVTRNIEDTHSPKHHPEEKNLFVNSLPEDFSDCYMVVGSSGAKEYFVHMVLRVCSVKVRCW